MDKKLLFSFVFILLISSIGYMIGNSTMFVADKVKSQFTYEEEEVVDGGIKVIDYVAWWRNLDEKAKPHGIRYTIIVEKWGKEIIESGNGFLETLKKTGKIILPFLVLLISFFFYKRYKKREKTQSPEELSFTNNRILGHMDSVNEGGVYSTASPSEIHHIRKLLIEWERRLNNIKKKESHETIQEWFQRIGGPIEIIPIYEKVRYGGKNCSQQELLYLKKLLK